LLIAAPEPFLVCLQIAGRKIRVAVLLAIIHVRPAMVAEVLPGPFDPIQKTAALHLSEFRRRGIPTAFRFRHGADNLRGLPVRLPHQVRHGLFITTAKPIPICLQVVTRDGRVAILVAVVYVWPAVVTEVPARAIDPI
jgi:hypothetical protein